MLLRVTAIALAATLFLTSAALAQPGRGAVPPAPLYLPPPPSSPQGLGVPRPLGYHVAPYGGLGYGPLGDRTGYPGGIYNTYRGSYTTPPAIPQLVLETPRGLTTRPGKLPTLGELFSGAPLDRDPIPEPLPLRMPNPTPPGVVVPVGAK